MTADNELGSDDGRTLEQVRYDAMSDKVHDAADTVLELAKLVKELAHGGTTNTVIHKTEGMGAVGILCACVCVFCALFIILGAVMIVPEIHDLRAWQDINRKDIARLQAQQQQGVKP
jgi:hypothetical protein